MKTLFQVVEDARESWLPIAMWRSANRRAGRSFQRAVVEVPAPELGGSLFLVHVADLPALADHLDELAPA